MIPTLQMDLMDFIKRRLPKAPMPLEGLGELVAKSRVSKSTLYNIVERAEEPGLRQVPINREKIAAALGYVSWDGLLNDWKQQEGSKSESKAIEKREPSAAGVDKAKWSASGGRLIHVMGPVARALTADNFRAMQSAETPEEFVAAVEKVAKELRKKG